MADISNSAWSETDASNNSVSPNGWKSGTMIPSEVEPVGRAMMGAIRRFYDHVNAIAGTGGTANAQTITYPVAPAAYATGDCYAFFPQTNTASTTLNINGLGAKTIKIGTSALIGGELRAAKVAVVYYDGTDFQLARGGDIAGQYLGTNTNDNATAGNIGEYTSSVIASGSAVSLTTVTAANVTQLSLTAGDWTVWGEVWFTSSVNQTAALGAINTTSATLPAVGDGTAENSVATTGTGIGSPVLPIAPCRISIASTTTVYLIAKATFGSGTCSAWGKLCARRAR